MMHKLLADARFYEMLLEIDWDQRGSLVTAELQPAMEIVRDVEQSVSFGL